MSHWPINYYVFAFDSIDPFALCQRHLDLHISDPLYERIDLTCILDKGVIVNTDVSKTLMRPLPDAETRIGFRPTEHALLLFYTLVSQIPNQATMQPFMFALYLQDVQI